MALFRLFKSKSKEDTKDAPVSTEIEQGNFDKEANTEKKQENKRVVTITWGTGLPIDVIFNYIHKDFEEEGFQDALVNYDINYRDTKVKIIRNNLEMLFKRIILRYKNDIRDINVNIDNARKAYALAAANQLQARRETFEEHLVEISEMQQLFEADDPKMTTMIESYRRGFQKGITAVSINYIENK